VNTIAKTEQLKKAIKLWLDKNDLYHETHFYSISEWRERKEDYHNESEFVIVSEGGLWQVLNYGTVEDAYEFEDLVTSMGFFYEMGHHWNFGFYKDETEVSPKKHISYSEKLKDSRWIAKRNYVRERADYKCEDCGSNTNLEVHHCFYQYGREPWEYSFDSLRCLCRKCHIERGEIEKVLRAKFAELKLKHLKSIKSLLSNGVLHYQKDSIFEMIESIDKGSKILDKNYMAMKNKST